jgi:hypothetical protein
MSPQGTTPGVNAKRYYGKYRGSVFANLDRDKIGRIQVTVPDVFGDEPSPNWAMPCVPAAGVQAGVFIVPPIGSQVWVEFEQGDPEYPVWTGGFWGRGEVPNLAVSPPAVLPGQNIVLQTTGQSIIALSDSAPTPETGGIVLKSGGAMILVNGTGIYIDNGQGATITLVSTTVAINNDGLTVVS